MSSSTLRLQITTKEALSTSEIGSFLRLGFSVQTMFSAAAASMVTFSRVEGIYIPLADLSKLSKLLNLLSPKTASLSYSGSNDSDATQVEYSYTIRCSGSTCGWAIDKAVRTLIQFSRDTAFLANAA